MLNKIERRERIKMRIRKIVSGTPAQPRMTVFRSNKQIYVQFIDDLAGVTLATASSLDKEVAEAAAGKTKCEVAALVGKLAAERAMAKGYLGRRFRPQRLPLSRTSQTTGRSCTRRRT